MANDYQFTFTDPTKSDFVVKPYTFNGHQTPANPAFYSNAGVTAVSANTSLVFLGKGMPDYGEAVQNNLVFLMENFANSVPPLEPKEGQLWYKNVDLVDAPNPEHKGMYVYNETTTSWDKLLVETSVGATSDLNMGGFKITNLGTPTLAGDATTKTYVDSEISTHGLDTDLHLTATQNVLLDGLSPTLSSAHLNFVEGTTSSVQTQVDGKVSKTGDVMTGALSMGSNKITSLATPTNPDDAVTKDYVDSALVLAGADGVVNAGALDPISGILTLGRTVGAPVVVSGTFAPTSHTHVDSSVTHDVSFPVNQSFLVGQALDFGTYPTPTMYDVSVYIDQAIYDLQRPVHREIHVTTGSTTTINLRPDMEYNVGENKLHVYANGIKQYASERGTSRIAYSDFIIGLTSDTGLAASTMYAFDITVDGGPPSSVTITTSGTLPYTHSNLLTDLNNELSLSLIPASVSIEQYLQKLEYVFTSHTSGVGSSIVISYSVGSLFESIVAAGAIPPVNTSITSSYAYEETGIPGEPSTTIELTTLPVAGIVLEVLH